jgi:hypothetical protein
MTCIKGHQIHAGNPKHFAEKSMIFCVKDMKFFVKIQPSTQAG